MSDETLLELSYHGREERNLECKRSIRWEDPATKVKIGKSAMANLYEGGSIVIGIDKQGEHYEPTGIEAAHLIT